jgi:ribosomal protein S18 acetylase RimI-like enzyme
VTADSAVRVRPAAPDDRAAIVDCVNAAYGGYVELMDRPPAPMLDDYAALIAAGHVRVAEIDGAMVGVIVMWAEPDHFYIDNIAVFPQGQGRGVGGVLLTAAESAARASGRDEIRLYTNEAMTANLGYYPRRGYVETHRSADSGYRRVYFAKHL